MSMYRYPMVNLAAIIGHANPEKKTFFFDKGVSSRLFLMAAKEQAIQEEMKRRKVRFLPKQVIRRVLEKSSTSLNPFTTR